MRKEITMKKTIKLIIFIMVSMLILAMMTGCEQVSGALSDYEVEGTTAEQIVFSAVGKLLGIALAIVSIIALCWAKTYIIPWLKEKGILRNIKNGVAAAEQLVKKGELPDDGASKNRFVKSFLESVGVQITNWVDTMIEAEVYKLKHSGTGALESLIGDAIVGEEVNTDDLTEPVPVTEEDDPVEEDPAEPDPDELAAADPEPVNDEAEAGDE